MKSFFKSVLVLSIFFIQACDFPFDLRQVYKARVNTSAPVRETCQMGAFNAPIGQLDTDFNGTGYLTGDFFGGDARLNSAVLTPQCDVIASVNHSGVMPTAGLIKLKLDGTIDQTFGTNGIVTFEHDYCALGVATTGANVLALQEDQKIIYTYCNANSVYVRRLNVDGSFDTTFATNGLYTLQINSELTIPQTVFIQPDGKILVAGHVGANNTVAKSMLIRLLPNGIIDPFFANAGVIVQELSTAVGKSIQVMADGSILLHSASELGNKTMFVQKFTQDGIIDPSFGETGYMKIRLGNINLASNMQLTAENKIVVAGVADFSHMGIAQLTADGNYDPTFGVNGKVLIASPNQHLYGVYDGSHFVIQENGDIVMHNFAVNYTMIMNRVDKNGVVVPFNGQNEIYFGFGNYTGYANFLLALPNGKLLAGTGLGNLADYKAVFYMMK